MPLADFHPAVRDWFADAFGEPTAPQREGWPLIREGRNTLIAAPTGTGKTLAAFMTAIDQLFRMGSDIPDETRVLYISPLRALSNDVQKNLQVPLQEIHERFYMLPELRVLVRTGDTSQSDREKMKRKPPHILVTTPESLYILLTSMGGRRILEDVRTVIVDEIHAMTGDKRGSHLALSLERLEALCDRPLQRIGLSATQKPLDEVGHFLVGRDRECSLVDTGHLRDLDLAVEIPPSPLAHVCSHEQWGEIHGRMAELIQAHKTTLVFVNTRKLSERIAARLSEVLGEDEVMSHHGSLSKEMRLLAEDRLKKGELRCLVATASLELGIDIGDVDLVLQVGTTARIATFLQRVGRSGHALVATPKGRIFPLTLDELCVSAALLRAIREGTLDRTPQPGQPLDILAQQIVAECVHKPWPEDELYERLSRAWPYRDLSREDFDRCLAVHSEGRYCLLHRDGVHGVVRTTKRARLTAILNGGAIPDVGDYRVLLEPEGLFLGTVNEDFAVESNKGDIFQLGNTSWRILRVERGTVRVADAKGQPPNIPFWFGEAPARSEELSQAVGEVREEGQDPRYLVERCGLDERAAVQLSEYLQAGRAALGAVPTTDCLILERFFDESGGMQLVLHSCFGGRINRAYGLTLRKRFCRGFGFELQAASNEDSLVLSLGMQHSFALPDVYTYLRSDNARHLLEQAMLIQPLFTNRWRWNLTRSLLLERRRAGKPVPIHLQRMRAEDMLALAFPGAIACPETLSSPDVDIPRDHPIVHQTIEDSLHETMDIDGFEALLRRIEAEDIRMLAIDTPEPSPFARSILNAMPYAFLDNAPLEERRTQAVYQRHTLDVKTGAELGELDPEAVARVRQEAWPEAQHAEEVHEALLWMGYVHEDEARENEGWKDWLLDLESQGRVVCEEGRWFAVEASREPKEVWRGRLEALGPVQSDDPVLLALEVEGLAMRTRIGGVEYWCDRRLLARIHRYTVQRLRQEIEPVSAALYLRFLARWQHVAPESRLHGPRGVAEVIEQLQGFEAPAAAWESFLIPARVRGYRREWLDELSLSGEIAWGRLFGAGAGPIKTTPISLLLREDLEAWERLAAAGTSGESCVEGLHSSAALILEAVESQGALFPADIKRQTRLLPSQLEDGLSELIGRGLLTCDSYAGLRRLLVPASKRKGRMNLIGRWSGFRSPDLDLLALREDPSRGRRLPGSGLDECDADFVAHQLLRRYGIVFRAVLERERQPIPWRDLLRVYRRLELRGEIRGGRFVAGFSGEQYADKAAIREMRRLRRDDSKREARGESSEPVEVSAADPLNLQGILTPDDKVPRLARRQVTLP